MQSLCGLGHQYTNFGGDTTQFIASLKSQKLIGNNSTYVNAKEEGRREKEGAWGNPTKLHVLEVIVLLLIPFFSMMLDIYLFYPFPLLCFYTSLYLPVDSLLVQRRANLWQQNSLIFLEKCPCPLALLRISWLRHMASLCTVLSN